MGRTRNYRYVLEIDTGPGKYNTPMEWRTRARYGAPGYGLPTNANLAKWVETYEASALPGGPNAHLASRGNPEWVHSAKITDQFTGRVLAKYRGASFRVF